MKCIWNSKRKKAKRENRKTRKVSCKHYAIHYIVWALGNGNKLFLAMEQKTKTKLLLVEYICEMNARVYVYCFWLFLCLQCAALAF